MQPPAIDEVETRSGYRFVTTPAADNSNSLMVVLTFSGGGMRAAALAYAVLEELRDTRIEWEGRRRRLLDEVDSISAVSGGSVTAAYYALHGDGIFADYEQRFLLRDIQGRLNRGVFNPLNWGRLLSPYFGRSDLFAEILDESVFEGATFGDIIARGRRPFVTINATDMSTGHRLEFIQDHFDLICADLASYPVSRAVAASSAVPVLLSPVVLQNHAGHCQLPDDLPITEALRDTPLTPRQRYHRAKLLSYRDEERRPYIYLLDGGLTDNLGLRSVLDSVVLQGGAWNLSRQIRITDVRKVAFFIINASPASEMSYGKSARPPGVSSVIDAIMEIPLDLYSFETRELLRASMARWSDDIRSQRADEELEFFMVDIDINALPDPEARAGVMNIPTRWRIEPEDMGRLREAASTLMRQSTDLQRLLDPIRADPAAGGRRPGSQD